MAGVKKPLSYLDLDRANPTTTLFEKLFRDSVDYKKEIDDVFEAIVLTDPTLATKSAESALKNQLITIPAEDPNKRTTYIFIARIIGRDSPHLFLPNPLEFNVTNDEDCKKRYHNLLQLHTKVTANGLSVSEMPAKGDTVQIRLVKGDYVYKTAFCNDFLGVTTKASSTPEVIEKLKANEEGAKGAFNNSNIARESGANQPATSYYKFSKDLSVLEKEAEGAFQDFFDELRKEDYTETITSTKRSVKHQWNLATGRLKSAGQVADPCNSDHQYGYALDLNFTDPNDVFISKKNTNNGTVNSSDWQKVADIASKHNIEWQGMGDPVHF